MLTGSKRVSGCLPRPEESLDGAVSPIAFNEPIHGRPADPKLPGDIVHRRDHQAFWVLLDQVTDSRLPAAGLLPTRPTP